MNGLKIASSWVINSIPRLKGWGGGADWRCTIPFWEFLTLLEKWQKNTYFGWPIVVPKVICCDTVPLQCWILLSNPSTRTAWHPRRPRPTTCRLVFSWLPQTKKRHLSQKYYLPGCRLTRGTCIGLYGISEKVACEIGNWICLRYISRYTVV